MKTFFISASLFFLMLAVIVGNGVYVCRTTDALEQELRKADGMTDLILLAEHWEKEKPYLQISIPHTKIDTANDLLYSLMVYAECHDTTEYQKTAVLLENAFYELGVLEKPTVANIL